MKHRSVKPCQIEGCSRYQWARGYCAAHYTDLKKSGRIDTIRPRGSAKDRFKNHFTVNAETGCWEWKGSTNRGYGNFCDDKHQIVRASRFAYENFVGPIPPGENVLHSCDNAICVNWEAHLFTGTQKVNMEDCSKKGRTAGQLGKIKHKVSDPMATNIRVMLARGYSIVSIAGIYSLHTSTVNGIVKGLAHLQVA